MLSGSGDLSNLLCAIVRRHEMQNWLKARRFGSVSLARLL